jgi:hypothetical protein
MVKRQSVRTSAWVTPGSGFSNVCRKNPRFAFESRHAVLVLRERFRQKFQRDAAAQFRISGLKNFTHSSCSEMLRDGVMRQPGADHAQTCLVIERTLRIEQFPEHWSIFLVPFSRCA